MSVVIMSLLTVALLHESSPLYQSPRDNSFLRIVFLTMNLPSVIVGSASGNLPLTILIFVTQWFLIGFLGAWLGGKIFGLTSLK